MMNKHNSRPKIHKKNDEYYTQTCAWDKLTQYIDKSKIIFEGFYGGGHTYDYFIKNGYKVIGKKGLDFFSNDADKLLDKCDCVITNPPFSLKYKIMSKLVKHNKPFILILPLACINTISFRNCFNNKMGDISIIIPKGRMKFIQNKEIKKSPSFESCYVCYKMLDDKLLFID